VRVTVQVGPRVQGEAKNAGADDAVEVVRHFAVVASFVVKFGASRRGFTIIDCRSNSGGGERASANYTLARLQNSSR
jgi:hypothetical protein